MVQLHRDPSIGRRQGLSGTRPDQPRNVRLQRAAPFQQPGVLRGPHGPTPRVPGAARGTAHRNRPRCARSGHPPRRRGGGRRPSSAVQVRGEGGRCPPGGDADVHGPDRVGPTWMFRAPPPEPDADRLRRGSFLRRRRGGLDEFGVPVLPGRPAALPRGPVADAGADGEQLQAAGRGLLGSHPTHLGCGQPDRGTPGDSGWTIVDTPGDPAARLRRQPLSLHGGVPGRRHEGRVRRPRPRHRSHHRIGLRSRRRALPENPRGGDRTLPSFGGGAGALRR